MADKLADKLLKEIADYVLNFRNFSQEALQNARLALFDSLACAMQALSFAECTQRLGPFFPGTQLSQGCHVPGTPYCLDPIQATFNLGLMIRWLDYNDTWLAQEWGHPSDNFASILMVAEWANPDQKMRVVLEAAIQAYEIQGILALNFPFNRVGFDHVILVKIASAALATKLMGGGKEALLAALSHAFIDAGPLRVYRHAPNTGPRKSWAAGDAAARGVFLAERALRGEPPCPMALSTPTWGVGDVFFHGHLPHLERPFDCYVMENILFKVAFPAEFHAQTAIEAALQLHPLVKDRIEAISEVTIDTHESALRIIDKTGPLTCPADRDHCLQYMLACALLFGTLTAEHYEETTAQDPRIDTLRKKMRVREYPPFSRDYLDPEKRSIASSLQLTFNNGDISNKITVEYPLGHRQRRHEALPHLEAKVKAAAPKSALAHYPNVDELTVREFLKLWPNAGKFTLQSTKNRE